MHKQHLQPFVPAVELGWIVPAAAPLAFDKRAPRGILTARHPAGQFGTPPLALLKRVLFVCTGNTCRSPMAEALFRELIKGRDDFEVESAGLGAFCGQPASKHTADLLRARGLDVAHHQSRAVTSAMVEAATHIFAMSHHHVHTLEFEFPEAADKLYLISEFCPDDALRGADVNDPFGAGRRAYQETLAQLEKMLPCVLAYIDQTWKPENSATDSSPSASDTMSTAPSNSTPPQQVAIAADHGGLDLKNAVVEYLRSNGHFVEDFGTYTGESVDYPDYAAVVSRQILAGAADAGILVCTSGIGMAIAANRFPGIQASLVSDPETAVTTREHNASNVLCLSGKSTSAEQAKAIVDAWLRTPFAGGRHGRRVEKMNQNRQRHPLDILEDSDPAVAAIIRSEQQRQQEHIELIASENFTSKAVMAAQGSCLTNKYAEGYPAKRWYGGCEEVDKVEQLAIDRVCQLFGARFANVQPHSGSQANTAVYFSVLEPGDRILTMNLAHGGHLTHGNKANFSGRFYEVVHYGVSQTDERIDYDELQKMAEECKPKMITAGASAYPRIIDFERMGRIAKSVGAYLFVDMAHIAGLVAGGMHPNPMAHADFVTSTTHKSLRGPRGGIILTNNEELAKKINSQVFPGVQGGPLMHVIAAKAVCFGECLRPGFADYSRQVVKNAQALAARLAELGYRIVSGGTDNHLMLVDLRPRGLNGKVASETLDLAGITVNKNGIPFDTEKITLGGGIRIGTPAVTTRGMKEAEMVQIGNWIDQALTNRDNLSALAAIKAEVAKVNEGFPLP